MHGAKVKIMLMLLWQTKLSEANMCDFTISVVIGVV
jgi:hypothetical protein